jgi:hypothetical protein
MTETKKEAHRLLPPNENLETWVTPELVSLDGGDTEAKSTVYPYEFTTFVGPS